AIVHLKEAGEYEQFAGDPEPEAERLAALLAEIVDLTDEDVELLMAVGSEGPAASDAKLAEEVAGVLRRARADAGPLPVARERRGLDPDEVAEALAERLGLAARQREKLRRYYLALELGLFEASGLSRKLRGALESLLQTEFVLPPHPATVLGVMFDPK